MSEEIIPIVGTANIETAEDGKKNIVLIIDNENFVFSGDTTNLTLILNGIVLGSWR